MGMSGFSDDNTVGTGSRNYCDKMDEAFMLMGRPQASAAALREKLETAGFVDVVVESVKQPFGPWPRQRKMKQIGAMVMLNAEAGLEAYSMSLRRRYGWRLMGVQVWRFLPESSEWRRKVRRLCVLALGRILRIRIIMCIICCECSSLDEC